MKRRVRTLGITAVAAATMAVSAFAAEGDATAALTTAFDGVKTSITTSVLAVLPIGLGIVGLVFGIKYAVKFFKKISNA